MFSVVKILIYTPTFTVTYILMDPIAGGLGAFLSVALNLTMCKYAMTKGLMVGGMPGWQLAAAVWTGAWIFQFVGHGLFESKEFIC